jgi:hypothetical protein
VNFFMQSCEESQDVEESFPPPAEYSQTVRLYPVRLSGETRKQNGLVAGQAPLPSAKGSQHALSGPHWV